MRRTARQRAASIRNLARARQVRTGAGTTILKMTLNKTADLATGGASGIISNYQRNRKRKKKR